MKAFVQIVPMLKGVMMIAHPRKKRYRADIVFIFILLLDNAQQLVGTESQCHFHLESA